jgi:hypothetical protein
MREAIILAAPFVIVLAALVWCVFFDKWPPDVCRETPNETSIRPASQCRFLPL